MSDVTDETYSIYLDISATDIDIYLINAKLISYYFQYYGIVYLCVQLQRFITLLFVEDRNCHPLFLYFIPLSCTPPHVARASESIANLCHCPLSDWMAREETQGEKKFCQRFQ